MGVSEQILSELKRYNSINNYIFEQEAPLPIEDPNALPPADDASLPPADDASLPPADTTTPPVTDTAEPVDVENDPVIGKKICAGVVLLDLLRSSPRRPLDHHEPSVQGLPGICVLVTKSGQQALCINFHNSSLSSHNGNYSPASHFGKSGYLYCLMVDPSCGPI